MAPLLLPVSVNNVKQHFGLNMACGLTMLLVLAGAGAGAGATAGMRTRRGLQQMAVCDAPSLPARTQRVMDECCPPPPPLLPGEEPVPTSCPMPESCGVPACAHEFLAFFDDCSATLMAQPRCESFSRPLHPSQLAQPATKFRFGRS